MVKNTKTKTPKDDWFTKFVLVLAIVEPITALPQVYKIITTKDASSLSLTTWILFTMTGLTWLVYGWRIKSKPLIASGGLWFIIDVVILILILIYG